MNPLNLVSLVFLLMLSKAHSNPTMYPIIGQLMPKGTPPACGTGNSCAFVTSTTYNGNLGGVSGADSICVTRATAADLPGAATYKAWIASSAADDPESRFIQSTNAYLMPNGTKIADNWTDLTDGSLDNNFNRDEFGVTISSPTYVWSDVGTNGTYLNDSNSCTGWTTSSTGVSGKDGATILTSSFWTNNSVNNCGVAKRIYCIQQ